MKRATVLVGSVAVMWVAAGLLVVARGRPQAVADGTRSVASRRALVSQYCVGCHSTRLKTGGLALDVLDSTDVGESADVWEKVVRKVSGGLMPPAGLPAPDASTRAAFVRGLEAELDRVAAAAPNPGRTETLHRLNRSEYQNVVRDLLGVEASVSDLLPADDASYGFDNMAGGLRVSQFLMERYLAAARKVSSLAVGTPPTGPVSELFRVSREQNQNEHVDGLPFGTRGGMVIHHTFPQDGEYAFRVQFRCITQKDLTCDGALGFIEPHQLEIAVDGERVQLFQLDAELVGTGERFYDLVAAGSPEGYETRVSMKGGPHEIAVAFVAKPSIESQQIRKRFEKPFFYKAEAVAIYQPFLEAVKITGPFGGNGVADTPSRRAVFVCEPTSLATETACATEILARLARRAYRRPVPDADFTGLLAFYREGRKDVRGFDAGIEMALRALLVSPEFLFRIEREPEGVVPGTPYRLADLELASRLSFFLWSSIPDDELLDLAAEGRLGDAATLERQVRRMIADPRSEALMRNVAGQWLQLRNIEAVRPFEPMFPDFDETLRQAFRTETELFFDSVVREDRSVVDLLAADYTFVNERLARHYGIADIRGSAFRRVTLTDERRRGLLGQGSILTVTSHPVRTSPVLRGKWILQNILGTPPPPPPPNVPTLQEEHPESGRAPRSIRERMDQHRANPVCASCHAMIDPLGFALENFDAVGAWRDRDEMFNVLDTSGGLPDGTEIDGVASLRAALIRQPERFVTTVAERFLTYGVGRGLDSYDMPAVRRIVRDAARSDYRFSSVILGVVNSLPFQMRNAAARVPATSAATR